MNKNMLNQILKDRKRKTRSLALILCLSMVVSLGTFAGFHKTASAKVYTREVLDCPYTYEGAEPVAHVHNDDCYEGETLVCTLPEREAHTHTDECFTEQRVLVCGLEENPGHQHSEECYDENGELICQIPEGEGAHAHTEECYTIERVLTCDKPELPVHVHDAGCFRTEEISVDEPEETVAPEQTVNTVPEMPVSDPNADVETASDWEHDFDGMELSGNWARDLVLVAATQQGRGESPNNFEAVLNDAGDAWVRHGYTRYGAWYGVPYAEEWSAMFVSFCLRYAGIPEENVPNNPTAAFMAESFSNGELFAGRDYVPAVGDLIFFDTVDDEITTIDHMGIVYHVDIENGTINTVEGDRTDAVATFGYTLDDEQIVGYGILPQNTEYNYTEEENTNDEIDGLIVKTEEEKQEETTVTADVTAPAVPMPAQSWERTAGGIKVTVDAPEGAFPENTKIAVTPVNGNNLKDTVSDAVNGEILEVQAVDITFFDAEGREIEPAVPIRVVMTPYENNHTEDKANVVHIDLEQQTAEVIAQAEGTEEDNTEVVFDAEAFTIYAIVYTVHFEYEVDGETYTSASMPGAEYTSLAEVIRGLGIVSEEEVETFVSKISTVASTNEEVAVVETTEDGLCVRVLKDGDAQIVITMQDGATFRVDVVADGETATGNETATVSTVGDLYLPAEAKVEAKVLTEEQSEGAIASVEAQEGTAGITAAAETAYQVFDISLENVDAEKYNGFAVEVKLPENVVGRDFRLYHIHDGETTEIELNTVSRPADDTGLEVVSGFTFETKDFSEFVLKYTVDFTYEGRTWSFPGQGSYRLADVLAVLGIEGSIDDASLTLIMGEDHIGALYLTQVDGEYYINSDIAFADTYELRVRVGEKIYIITVTDTTESTNLSDFLQNAVVTGATQDSDGKYHVESGKEYSIILTFAEGSAYQFANRAELEYQMPEGIKILTRQENDGTINIVYKGRTYQVGFHYVLETDGKLKIKFDQSDPDFERLAESTNVSFRFTYNGAFDKTTDIIDFSDIVHRQITFDEPEPAQAYVSKSGTFDETTGKFNYTITVTADGDVTNVNVKDVITGNALNFNNDVQVSGNSSSYTDNGAVNGFDYTFASMAEGETITITYSANVNFGADANKDGKIEVDQTKNTVTVKPKDGDPHNSEFSREINYKTTAKSDGTDGGTTAEGNKIINWTIDYNPLALASAAGDTIKDTIGDSSQDYMKYYGSGITVEVRDHSGTLVETRTIPYSSLTAHSDATWTYTIPETDTTPYHYTITYQTVVDMQKVEAGGVTISLDNDGNGDHGGVSVTPKNLVDIKKDVESFNTQEVTWISTISVPEGGLAQAVVTDFLPRIWLNESNHYDVYKDGSLEITGLLGGETYTVEYGQGSVTITFSKDGESGLKGTPGGHNITIKLTTKVDQEWLQKGYETGNWEQNHTNTITLGSKSDTATVTFGKPGIEKTGERQGESSFKYTVVLSGISEVPVNVEDTFDTSLLEVDTSKANEWDHMKIWGGNQYSQDSGKTPISYTDTPDGILLTANSIPKDSDGHYYPYYKIIYYLKLKDGVDLEQLAIANGGEHHLVNTAKWGDHETEFDYKTTYDYLDKKLLNSDAELGGINRKARYQITFNPAKATLHDCEPMVMTDVMSANLSVDYGSIQIETDPAGLEVPYSLSGEKDEQGNQTGRTIATYTVPDSTKVVITYEALVVGNGSQTIINTVSVNGHDETITTTKSYGTASEGEGAIASFKIVKVDGYDANKKLAGVKFKIFAENPEIDFGEKAQPPHTKELILETDENGEINLDGEEYDFYFNECYHIQEVEPLDDYGTISFDYLVTLTNDMSHVDYNHYTYYYSDSMQIKNWPLEGLVVEKQVESPDAADKEQYYKFRVSILKDDGQVDTSYNEKNGDDTFVNGVVEFQLKDKEQKMFWGFTKGTKYKVEEIDSKGLAVSFTYSTYDEDGKVIDTITVNDKEHTGTLTQENEVIIFKNSREQKGALKLKKLVTVNGTATTGILANGDYTFTVTGPGTSTTVNKTVTIKVENGVATKYKIDNETMYTDLPEDKFVLISDLTPGEYTITETGSTNTNVSLASITGGKSGTVNVQNKQVTVTVTAGGTIAAEATATFTNNIGLGSLEITKNIQRNGTADTTATGKKFYYAVYDAAYNSSADPAQTPVATGLIEVTENGAGKDTVSDLPYGTYYVYELTGQGGTPIASSGSGVQKVINDTIYTVTGSGTSATIGSSATTGFVTLTNNEETTDVSVEKQWKPAIPENTTIKLGLYSGKTVANATTQVTTIVLDGTAERDPENINGTKAGTKQETSAWNAAFKNLPKYANDTDGVYEIQYIVKEESMPEGYTVSYSGDSTTYVITGGTITNTKNPGDLELTKKVAGDGADTSKEFEFTIKLTAPDGETLKNSYSATHTGDSTITTVTVTEDKVSGIKLKADDVFTIKDLPAGTTYKITENDYSADGYSASANAEKSPLEGTITGGEKEKEEVEITNTYSAGGLTVEKIISGNDTDNKKEFSFEVEFVNAEMAGKTQGTWTKTNGTPTPISFGSDSDNSGKAKIEFTLKGGEKVEFNTLPSGTTFTVKEISADQAGYETTVETTGGMPGENKSVTGTITTSAAITVKYTNTKDKTDIEATKAWKSGDTSITWPEDVESVEFTLFVEIDGVVTEAKAISDNSVKAYFAESVINDAVKTVTKDTEGGKASWSDLPTKVLIPAVEENGIVAKAAEWKEVKYSVVETKVTFTDASGKEALTTAVAIKETYQATDVENPEGSGKHTITNELPKTSIEGTKTWVTAKEHSTPVLTLSRTVESSATPAPTPEIVKESGTDNPLKPTWTGNNYKYENLPKYNEAGKEYTYTVAETSFVITVDNKQYTYTVDADGKVTIPEGAPVFVFSKDESGLNFTNTEVKNFEFSKVWTTNGTAVYDSWPTDVDSITVTLSRSGGPGDNEGGTVEFTVKKDGISPATSTEGSAFAFHAEIVSDSENVYSYKISGLDAIWQSETGSGEWTYSITETPVGGYNSPKYFTVQNETWTDSHGVTGADGVRIVNDKGGVELPQTGGIGTTLFTALGGLITVTAGAILTMRRGKRKTAES